MADPVLSEEEMQACNALRLAVCDSKGQWTYQRLADAVDSTYNKVNNMAIMRKKPDYELLEKIRLAMGLPEGWPRRPVDKLALAEDPTEGVVVSLAGIPLKPIQLAGQVAAGQEVWNVDAERRIVHVPSRLADLGSVGFVVEGDSMMPMLKELDTAVFRRRSTPKDGAVFLLKMGNGAMRVKLIEYDRHDWYLTSLNKKYRREIVPDDAQLLGVLMGWYRVDGSRETMDLDTEYLRPELGQLRNFEE